MPQMLNCNDKTQGITLSSDLFTAKTDGKSFGSVRAIEPILKQDGVYYYEVKILSATSMQIGWATKKCFLDNTHDNGMCIGKNVESIGIDGFRKVLLQDSEFKIQMSSWKSGDVLGCLINVSEKVFVYYLNGQTLHKEIYARKQKVPNVSDLPFYPAASLSANSEVFFNFGQHPFKFPPRNIKFCDFYGFSFNKYFQSLDPYSDGITDIVLSSDFLSARDPSKPQNDFKTFEAWQSIKSGTYFYEVHLLTDGSMKVGWKSTDYVNSNYRPQHNLDDCINMDDASWISFDGYRKLIWYSNQKFDIGGSCWQKGDIVGCLINVEQKNVMFFLNGKEHDVAKLEITLDCFDNEYHSPSISLTAGQQVYCNFGQEPFRFAPKSVEFKDFYGNQFN